MWDKPLEKIPPPAPKKEPEWVKTDTPYIERNSKGELRNTRPPPPAQPLCINGLVVLGR